VPLREEIADLDTEPIRQTLKFFAKTRRTGVNSMSVLGVRRAGKARKWRGASAADWERRLV
jgi:hypothetical protein